VDEKRLGNLIADAHHRIERGHRLLKNQRDARATHFAHFAFGQGEKIAALEHHAAARDSAW
jgi:hypothetical protein